MTCRSVKIARVCNMEVPKEFHFPHFLPLCLSQSLFCSTESCSWWELFLQPGYTRNKAVQILVQVLGDSRVLLSFSQNSKFFQGECLENLTAITFYLLACMPKSTRFTAGNETNPYWIKCYCSFIKSLLSTEGFASSIFANLFGQYFG